MSTRNLARVTHKENDTSGPRTVASAGGGSLAGREGP